MSTFGALFLINVKSLSNTRVFDRPRHKAINSYHFLMGFQLTF